VFSPPPSVFGAIHLLFNVRVMKVKKTVGGGKGFWRKAVLARRAAGRKNMHRAHKVILDFVRLEEELERRPVRGTVRGYSVSTPDPVLCCPVL
jgi:hypothetical protein